MNGFVSSRMERGGSSSASPQPAPAAREAGAALSTGRATGGPADRRRYPSAAGVFVLLVVALLAAAPGATQVRGDEQHLLLSAARANAEGRWVTEGLVGSTGVRYGPLPTQFYQVALALSPDLRDVVLLRTLACAGVAAACLWSIGRSLGLGAAFVGVAMASPPVWYYLRTPWDNTFVLPLGCALLAAYAGWLRRPTFGKAVACGALSAAMPLVHLASMALPLAVAGHALLSRHPARGRFARAAALGAVLGCSTSLPYLATLPAAVVQAFSHRPPVAVVERLEIAAYALRAPELLGAAQAFIRVPDEGLPAVVSAVAGRLGLAGYAWLAAGLAVGMSLGRGGWSITGDTRRALAGVSVSAVLLLGAVLAFARVNWHPHYLCGVYAPVVVLCWMGVDRLWRHPVARWGLVIVPATAVLATTVLLAYATHRAGGSPGAFGHSIGSLMQVVDALRGHAATYAYTDSGELYLRGNTLAALRWIDARGATPTAPPPPTGTEVVIRLRRAFAGDHALRVDFTPLDPDERERLFRVSLWPTANHPLAGVDAPTGKTFAPPGL